MSIRSNKRRWLTALLTAALMLGAVALLISSMTGSGKMRVLTDEELAAALEANEGLSSAQRTLVESCVSLRGRVHYFWGGKYYKLGEDPDWGSPRTVESGGSSTTGAVRPYGLDCSGYVTWAYIQAGVKAAEIGDGTWTQWQNSDEIRFDELRVGDLVFQHRYPGANGNHVGICIGFSGGRPVFAHCSSAYDNVVVTTAGGVFRYARRPHAALGS